MEVAKHFEVPIKFVCSNGAILGPVDPRLPGAGDAPTSADGRVCCRNPQLYPSEDAPGLHGVCRAACNGVYAVVNKKSVPGCEECPPLAPGPLMPSLHKCDTRRARMDAQQQLLHPLQWHLWPRVRPRVALKLRRGQLKRGQSLMRSPFMPSCMPVKRAQGTGGYTYETEKTCSCAQPDR